MINKLGGRKAVMAYIAIVVGTAVALVSPTSVSTEFVALLLGIVTAFSAGNSAEHLASALGKKKTKVDTSKMEDAIAQVRQRVDSIEHQNSIIGQSISGQAQAIQTIAGRLSGK